MNLTKIKVTGLDGETVEFDMSKPVGNWIYTHTGDLGMLEVAQEIYKEGKAELSDEQKKEVVSLLEAPACPFLAAIKKEIIKQLDE
jgi:hypothetical protein